MGLVFQPQLEKDQELACRLLESAVSAGKLANAYLLTGDNSSAKFKLASQIAAYLNCQSQDKATAGSCLSLAKGSMCQNCSWIEEGKHPQAWLTLAGAEAGKKIPVESARNLAEEFTKTSSYRRVAVVAEAAENIFHRPSANALLKTIEEPRGNGVFFMFARSADVVLTTIVSRCQVIPVVMPGDELVGPVQKSLSKGESLIITESEEEKALLRELEASPFYEWSKAMAKGDMRHARHSRGNPVQCLNFVRVLNDAVSEVDPAWLIDAIYLTELQIIGSKSPLSWIVTDYLNQLLRLCEEAKSRISRYVGKKAVFECLVFQWRELRFQI